MQANDLALGKTHRATAMPAVLVGGTIPGSLRVASLTPLDRLIVAAHRAGCHPIYVVNAKPDRPLPRLRRAPALGVGYTVTEKLPALEGLVFVAEDSVMLTAPGVRALMENRARLAVGNYPQPAGVLARLAESWREDLNAAPVVESPGVAAAVTDAASARQASRLLWTSLTSASDGWVDRHFNRPVGRGLSKLLIRTPVTPNQVSLAATLLGILSAVCFAAGGRRSAIVGALLLQISAIVDCVDGDVARAVFKESPLGKWLDIVGDQVVHISVFVAIGLGLWRAGGDAPVMALALSAGIGVVLSFGVILRNLLQPSQNGNSALQRLIDATTNRDFSVLLLALACVDRLVWFLWLAAFGVHVFWVLALSLQMTRRTPASA
jgi:phosphatidylglycerophosphate synthase